MGIQPASHKTVLGTSVPYIIRLEAHYLNISKRTGSLPTLIGIYEEFFVYKVAQTHNQISVQCLKSVVCLINCSDQHVCDQRI